MGKSQNWHGKKRRLYRLKSRDFDDARRRALKARDRGDSPKSRSWASEAREHIRRGPEYTVRARRGRQSQDRGRRAQSRDVKWFAERVGWENVRDRSKQEAAAIRLGADYDVFGPYPLVVQRKHAETTPKKAWQQLIKAPASPDQIRVVHLELPRNSNGRRLDLVVMDTDDANHLLFHVAHLDWGQFATVSVKERFNLRDRWREAVDKAAKFGRGIAIVEACYKFETGLEPYDTRLWIFEWKVFQKAWELACASGE